MKASRPPIQKPADVRLSRAACHLSASDCLSVGCQGWLTAKGITEETGEVLTLEGIDLLLFHPIRWD